MDNPQNKISFTNVLLPDPDSPVTAVITPKGNLTFIFFKLCSLAPLISINIPLPFLRFSGNGIYFSPLRYCPVIDFSTFSTSLGVPCATTYPPCSPAPGPISTTQSASRIVSSSCSTTIKVFPKSRIPLRVFKSFSLSL